MYPHVQKEAQKEIDAVIGSKRMPTWSDRPNLPYVRAVVEETLRCTSTACAKDGCLIDAS